LPVFEQKLHDKRVHNCLTSIDSGLLGLRENRPKKPKAGRLSPALRTEKLSIAELSQISFPLTSF